MQSMNRKQFLQYCATSAFLLSPNSFSQNSEKDKLVSITKTVQRGIERDLNEFFSSEKEENNLFAYQIYMYRSDFVRGKKFEEISIVDVPLLASKEYSQAQLLDLFTSNELNHTFLRLNHSFVDTFASYMSKLDFFLGETKVIDKEGKRRETEIPYINILTLNPIIKVEGIIKPAIAHMEAPYKHEVDLATVPGRYFIEKI